MQLNMQRGKKSEKELSNYGKTQLERILLGLYTKDDINFDFTNPKELAKWISIAAKDGPEILSPSTKKPTPITVTVSGAAGGIAYSLLPRLCAGDVFGPRQPIILRLLDVESQIKKVEGVSMELQDCAFPLIQDIVVTSDLDAAFFKTDYCFLIGSTPRKVGQERSDVLKENAIIFKDQGQAIDRVANPKVLVLVVGNPANTNALILSSNAPNIPSTSITAMARLDHDRGLAQIAQKAKCKISDIDRFCIWGNHSSTQYPDVSHTTIKGKWLRDIIKDEQWIYNELIPKVQKRGSEVLSARGKSSQQSAANSALNHMRDWAMGNSKWVSMAVKDGSYNIPSDIYCSYPVFCTGFGNYQIIKDLPIDEKSAQYINQSVKELYQEKEAIQNLLPPLSFKFVRHEKDIFSWKYILSSASKDVHSLLIQKDELLNKAKISILEKLTDTPWRMITKDHITKVSSQLDLSLLDSAITDPKEKKMIMEVIEYSLEKDIEVTKRKSKLLSLELHDIELYDDQRFIQLPENIQIKFLQERLFKDGSLSEKGFGGLLKIDQEIKDAINLKKEKGYYSESGKREKELRDLEFKERDAFLKKWNL